VKFRLFKPDDADFCFRVRSQAFNQKFSGELTAEQVAAGVNAYPPYEIIIIIVEEDDQRVGFFAIQKINVRTAELLWIYIDLQQLGTGIGKACIEFIESWLASNWNTVNRLIVDTVIPKYNRKFYQKMGFAPAGRTFCEFMGVRIPALQLCKTLGQ
jgi:GNAT superfamily N-acetyltransferase